MLIVAVVFHEPRLDDVDLLLRLAVDDRGDVVLEVDRVLAVIKELLLEGLLEALVGACCAG